MREMGDHVESSGYGAGLSRGPISRSSRAVGTGERFPCRSERGLRGREFRPLVFMQMTMPVTEPVRVDTAAGG